MKRIEQIYTVKFACGTSFNVLASDFAGSALMSATVGQSMRMPLSKMVQRDEVADWVTILDGEPVWLTGVTQIMVNVFFETLDPELRGQIVDERRHAVDLIVTEMDTGLGQNVFSVKSLLSQERIYINEDNIDILADLVLSDHPSQINRIAAIMLRRMTTWVGTFNNGLRVCIRFVNGYDDYCNRRPLRWTLCHAVDRKYSGKISNFELTSIPNPLVPNYTHHDLLFLDPDDDCSNRYLNEFKNLSRDLSLPYEFSKHGHYTRLLKVSDVATGGQLTMVANRCSNYD